MINSVTQTEIADWNNLPKDEKKKILDSIYQKKHRGHKLSDEQTRFMLIKEAQKNLSKPSPFLMEKKKNIDIFDHMSIEQKKRKIEDIKIKKSANAQPALTTKEKQILQYADGLQKKEQQNQQNCINFGVTTNATINDSTVVVSNVDINCFERMQGDIPALPRMLPDTQYRKYIIFQNIYNNSLLLGRETFNQNLPLISNGLFSVENSPIRVANISVASQTKPTSTNNSKQPNRNLQSFGLNESQSHCPKRPVTTNPRYETNEDRIFNRSIHINSTNVPANLEGKIPFIDNEHRHSFKVIDNFIL